MRASECDSTINVSIEADFQSTPEETGKELLSAKAGSVGACPLQDQVFARPDSVIKFLIDTFLLHLKIQVLLRREPEHAMRSKTQTCP